ncbi:Nucleolar protein 14 [Cryptosporidium tyzzeri]|nr:Nucleolar protein 14 [Cryptosporidium tyzzeri]
MAKNNGIKDLSSAFNVVKYKKKDPHLKVIKSRNSSKIENSLDKRKDKLGFNDRDFLERKRSILKELYSEGRKSEFNDEREKFALRKDSIGDNYQTLIATKQLKKKVKKRKNNFNLDEEDDDNDYRGYFGENLKNNTSTNDLEFTHQGKSISALDDKAIRKYDGNIDEDNDFNDNDYTSSRKGDSILDEKNMPGFFFGQGNSDGTSIKSRQEIFKEIMQKSKLAKMEMKRHRESLEEELVNLDSAFSQVQSMLSYKQSRKDRVNSLLNNINSNSSVTNNNGNNNNNNIQSSDKNIEELDEYEQLRNLLKFDTRTGVSDRIKTDEEIAKLNAEKLERLEKERKERMNLDDSNIDIGLSTESENEYFKDEFDDEDGEEEDGFEEEEEEEEEEEGEEEEEEEGQKVEKDCFEEEEEDREGEGEGEEEDYEDDEERVKLASKGFIDFELNEIDWLVNDESEPNLSFSVNLKKILKEYSLKGLMEFMNGFSPKSQWKFICRFRSCFNKGDTAMLNDLKLLIGFLIKYPLNCLRTAESDSEKKDIFQFIINYLKLMSSHLLFMAETDPKECLIIFTYFTFEICHTTFPSVYHKYKKVEKFLNDNLLNVENENYYTEILEECPSLYQLSEDIYELTLEHIVICRMMFILFPVTDAQHPILTPVIMCLEQWAHRWSQVGKSLLNIKTPDKDSEEFKYNQIRLVGGSNPNISCMIGVICLLEISSIGYANSKSNNNGNELLERFSIGYFTLSLSCLKWLLLSDSDNNISIDEKRISLSIGILKSLIRVISAFKDLQGFHAIIIHLIRENIKQINESLMKMDNCKVLLNLVSEIESISTEIANRPQKPISLCPRQTPTIRSLIPKIDDPSVPFAAKAMLRAKNGPKESQYEHEKKHYLSRLKKEVNTARRQASRQLRKDSQVIASAWHENRMEKSNKQNSKYNSFMKMLEDDQAEYKRMKTTGGTMDTSIQSYRANKQNKKKNQKMAGNKTANGLVH